MKQAAERAEALEADFETNLGDGKVAGGEQVLRFFETLLGQILMGSFVEGFGEQSQKMIRREKCLSRDLIQIERQIEAFIDIRASEAQAMVNVAGRFTQPERRSEPRADVQKLGVIHVDLISPP